MGFSFSKCLVSKCLVSKGLVSKGLVSRCLVSRFIDQLPRQGFGPFRVALLDGVEQFDVQIEDFLASRGDVQGLAQLRADDA
ncbi:hypothetical protein C9I50_19100 [Pseudomonas prosekii]|nr:hypothetical protein C9I50_19100 [Pseudomonas prosekii]